MRAKITSMDMCAPFSLRRANFLRKCSINRKLDVIEKNGQRIRNQQPQNHLETPTPVQLAENKCFLSFSVIFAIYALIN